MLRITATGLSTADGKLRQFAARIIDWRPFWRVLGRVTWPTKRKRAGRYAVVPESSESR